MVNSKLTALFAIALLSSSAVAIPVAQLGVVGGVLGLSSTSSVTSLDETDQTPITSTSSVDVPSVINGTPVIPTVSLSNVAASSTEASSSDASTTPLLNIPLLTSSSSSEQVSSTSGSSRSSTSAALTTSTEVPSGLLNPLPVLLSSTEAVSTSSSSRSSTGSRSGSSSSSSRTSSGPISTSRASTVSRSSTSSSSRATTTSRSSSSTKRTSSSTVLTTGVAKQTPLSSDDVAILQLALYLEKLEGTLYSKGFNQFNEQQFEMEGFARPFRDNVGLIVKQEATHASTITSILVANKVTPVQNCTYNFDFPSVKKFIATGNMVSTVGVGAYLAGGGILKDNAFLLGAASSILTVEARHDAYLRGGIGANPYPSSFDTIVPAPYAYNLAQAFIVKCQSQLNYPIYPKLNLTSPVIKPNLLPNLKAGQNITFAFNPTTIPNYATLSMKPLYIALLNSVNNVSYTPIVPCGTGCASILLPAGLSNIAFAVMTNLFGATLDTLVASGTLAGPCELPIN